MEETGIIFPQIRRMAVLQRSWARIRHNSTNSLSPETVRAVVQFGEKEITNLKRIQGQLRNGYKFTPARATAIPRPGKAPRPIISSSIPDRIVQRSILKEIEKVKSIEQMVENPNSFGGRRGGSVKGAIQEVCCEIKKGASYYLTTDISNFFTGINKKKVLATVSQFIKDEDFLEILRNATEVEISNMEVVENNPNIFPTAELGVAQGCSLSPFMGNIYLSNFDNKMNSNEVRCIRYIDDIIFLGPNRSIVRKQFTKGRKYLRSLGLKVYDPDRDSQKASDGLTSKRIDYLGCSISRDGIFPDKASRKRLMSKVEEALSRSERQMVSTPRDVSAYKLSIIRTLSNVSSMLMGWGNQYSFCTFSQVFEELDDLINDRIKVYLQKTRKVIRQSNRVAWRRNFGIFSLSDRKTIS